LRDTETPDFLLVGRFEREHEASFAHVIFAAQH
jgi:hypothetical protein